MKASKGFEIRRPDRLCIPLRRPAVSRRTRGRRVFIQRIFSLPAYVEAVPTSPNGAIAMPAILDEFRRYMKRARAAIAIAPSDDCRRSNLLGVRRHNRVGQFDAQDEHAEWLGFADSPAGVEVARGSRGGLAGNEELL